MLNKFQTYEPLSSENSALVLVDHQINLVAGVRDYDIETLKHNIVALARSAKSLDLPIIVTTTASDTLWGPLIPELAEVLTGITPIERSLVNAFEDDSVIRAIEALGRKKLIFAGVSLNVCAAFPAMTAVHKGYDAYVAVDASGAFGESEHELAIPRLYHAGVVASDYATLMIEILKDNARPDAGEIYSAIDMGWSKMVGQIRQSITGSKKQ